MDERRAIPSLWLPAARPTPIARKTYTASFVSSKVVRNRTAATIPARLKARATLVLTTTTIPVTATGKMISVCTTDWSYPPARPMMMYVQATGTMMASAPSKERA